MGKAEDELKQRIKEKYGSIKNFSKATGLPYTTLDSILKRGIMKASTANILKITNELGIGFHEENGEIVFYEFKDIPQGPVINAEATKAYFTKKNAPTTIAAHFDGDEYTEEELEQIRKFAEFVKSQRKDGDTPELNAAHARTDVDIPEGADTSDNDIMNDENF